MMRLARSSSSALLLASAWLVLLSLLAAVDDCGAAFQCYFDTSGVKRATNAVDAANDLERFKKYNCSLMGGGKIERPCMTKTDKNGIVTRNCATIMKQEDGCERDSHGNILCYCLADLCNAVSTPTASGHGLVLSALAVASGWISTRV